jgi:hypothetical protein
VRASSALFFPAREARGKINVTGQNRSKSVAIQGRRSRKTRAKK